MVLRWMHNELYLIQFTIYVNVKNNIERTSMNCVVYLECNFNLLKKET